MAQITPGLAPWAFVGRPRVGPTGEAGEELSDATAISGVDPEAPAPGENPGPGGRTTPSDPTRRIGPFTVGRSVCAGPGAHIYEAIAVDGARRLLQVVRLGPTSDTAGAEARQAEERRIARRTADLLSQPGMIVHAHGGADGADGSRLLFWALPYDPAVPIVRDSPVRDVGGLLKIARAVATYLADRHGRGQVEPLLSEHHLAMDEGSGPRILGVPVDVSEAWLAEDFPGPRRAPEEVGAAVKKSGDVWRLGRALQALSQNLALPEDVARFIESLVRPAPERRPASGAEVLGDLDGLLASAPDLMGVGDVPDPGLFPAEEVTQSSVPLAEMISTGGTDPLAVTTWGPPVWTEVEANALPMDPGLLPGVVDPDAPTRAETAEAPGALRASLTDPDSAAEPVSMVNWTTDPGAAPSRRPEPVTDQTQHNEVGAREPDSPATSEVLREAEQPTTQAVAQAPGAAEPEVGVPAEAAALKEARPELPPVEAPAAEAEAEPEAEAVAAPAQAELQPEPEAGSTEPEAEAAQAEAAQAEAEAAQAEPVEAQAKPVAEVASPEPAAAAHTDAVDAGPVESEPAVAEGALAADAGEAPPEDVQPEPEDPGPEPAVAATSEPAQADLPMVASSDFEAISPAESEADEGLPEVQATLLAPEPSQDGPQPDAAPAPAETPPSELESTEPALAPAEGALPSSAEGVPTDDEAAAPVSADGATTLTDGDAAPSAVAVRGTSASAGAEDPAAMKAIAAGWDQPVLPSGESPWSEVLSPRGAHRRAHETFEGFEDSLPDDALPSNPPVVNGSSPPISPVFDEDDDSAAIAAAISGFDPRKVAGGVLAVLVILGLFALISRSGEPDLGPQADVAPSLNEFVLDSAPQGALVVSQADGRVLGKTPMSFLVPPAVSARLFLVADGHEPLALELLERGGIEARLQPSVGPPCTVTVQGPPGATLESVAGIEIPPGEVEVPGGLLIRARSGQSWVGAELVRCPDRGGQDRVTLEFGTKRHATLVRITEPAGAAAYLNGEPVGRVPTSARTDRAFLDVRVDDATGMSESRWVPARGALEIRMPTPKARRRPRLVVPDTRPGDADVAPDPAEVSAPAVSDAAQRRLDRLKGAGERHLKAGRTRRASRSYRECLRLDPGQAECHRGLGDLYRQIGKKEKARVYYERYLELAANPSDAGLIRGYLQE